MTTFTIKSFDLELGNVEVEFDTPDGPTTGHFLIESAVASDAATELELANGLSQLVKQRLAQLYPPPHPRPAALEGMLGQVYEVAE